VFLEPPLRVRLARFNACRIYAPPSGGEYEVDSISGAVEIVGDAEVKPEKLLVGKRG